MKRSLIIVALLGYALANPLVPRGEDDYEDDYKDDDYKDDHKGDHDDYKDDHTDYVPGPTITKPVTTEVEVTYTSLCPTTETVYGPTKTHLTTYTITSKIVTHVPTTIYTTVPGKDVTKTEKDVVYSTITKLYPVTETKTVDGKEQTITYTKTKLIETKIPTTVYETEYGKPTTHYEKDYVYSTITKVYPVTEVTTIDGKKTTITKTKTKIVETKVPTTVYETEHGKPTTHYEKDYVYSTITKVYPVTEVTTIDGKETTITKTKTKVVETKIPTTVYETEYGKPTTHYEKDYVYSTITKVYPVTEVTTIDGKKTTVTHTKTKVIETKIPTTVYETEYGKPTTYYEKDYVYSTLTKEYPVTEVTTIDGKETTVTHTKTKVIETKVPVTVLKTVSNPGKTVSKFDVEHVTKELTYAVTKTDVVEGEDVTQTFISTQTTVEEVPQTTTVEELPAEPTGGADQASAPGLALLAAVGGVLALF